MEQQQQEFFIHNAGLIITWPYLTTLFERLEITDQDKFIDDIARNKALHALQYLGTNTTENSEHDLLLNKILCGFKINFPAKHKHDFTAAEIDVMDSLLTAIRQNWPSMENTSNEALQDTFLKRQGGLTRNSESWYLKVMPKAYDVLLSRLPWSINRIQLPWMPMPIEVEWK